MPVDSATRRFRFAPGSARWNLTRSARRTVDFLVTAFRLRLIAACAAMATLGHERWLHVERRLG